MALRRRPGGAPGTGHRAPNELGVYAGDVTLPVTRSHFLKNDTAIRIGTNNDESACADLHKVIFVKNKLNLDGPRCAAWTG